MADKVLAWHFVRKTLRDGRPVPPDNEPLYHSGKIELCASGLHASEQIVDAFRYCHSPTLCRVIVENNIQYARDKLVGSKRTILWRYDITQLFSETMRLWALMTVHLWDMPPSVRTYLTTGEEKDRVRARKTLVSSKKWKWGWSTAKPTEALYARKAALLATTTTYQCRHFYVIAEAMFCVISAFAFAEKSDDPCARIDVRNQTRERCSSLLEQSVYSAANQKLHVDKNRLHG